MLRQKLSSVKKIVCSNMKRSKMAQPKAANRLLLFCCLTGHDEAQHQHPAQECQDNSPFLASSLDALIKTSLKSPPAAAYQQATLQTQPPVRRIQRSQLM
jgi:hypothetical protein